MADHEDELLAAGAEILWILEADSHGTPGTMDLCSSTMDDLGSAAGWCLGDAQTQPVARVFDESPFSVDRGFDMIVSRQTMEILWVSSHGSPSGNENLDGLEVVNAVEQAVALVR